MSAAVPFGTRAAPPGVGAGRALAAFARMGRRVHTESPIYRSGVRRRRVSATAPLRWIVGVVGGVRRCSSALVGVAFAGSSTTLAEGRRSRASMSAGMARERGDADARARSAVARADPVSFTAGRPVLRALGLATRRSGRLAGRCRRRLPPAAAASAVAGPPPPARPLLRRSCRAAPDCLRRAALRARPDRGGRGPAEQSTRRSCATASRSRVQPGHPGTRIDRGRSLRDDRRASSARSTGRRPSRLPVASTTPSRAVRPTSARLPCEARRRSRHPSASPTARPAGDCRAGASHPCSQLPERRRDPRDDRRPRRRAVPRAARRDARAQAAGRTLPGRRRPARS